MLRSKSVGSTDNCRSKFLGKSSTKNFLGIQTSKAETSAVPEEDYGASANRLLVRHIRANSNLVAIPRGNEAILDRETLSGCPQFSKLISLTFGENGAIGNNVYLAVVDSREVLHKLPFGQS